MTLAMLGLAGIPATAGFIGKFYLIDAAIDGDYAWLGVVIVIGSMISLAYYLKVIAAMWMAEAPVAGTALQTLRTARAGRRLGRGRQPRASRSRRGSWRSSAARRRSSSGSCPRRCSTWPSTPGARSPTCSRETESLSRPGPTSGGVRGGFAVCAACGTSSARA